MYNEEGYVILEHAVAALTEDHSTFEEDLALRDSYFDGQDELTLDERRLYIEVAAKRLRRAL